MDTLTGHASAARVEGLPLEEVADHEPTLDKDGGILGCATPPGSVVSSPHKDNNRIFYPILSHAHCSDHNREDASRSHAIKRVLNQPRESRDGGGFLAFSALLHLALVCR